MKTIETLKKLSTMKSYHICLGILLFSLLVRAQNRSNNDTQYGGVRIRDIEEMEDSQNDHLDDIEVGLDTGKWYGDVGEKSFKEAMLLKHNEFRRRVSDGMVSNQPSTDELDDFVWDDNLAQLAKNRSQTCQFGRPSRYEIDRFGQNMAYSETVEEGFKIWTAESRRYNFQKNECILYCKSYKQLVSALTKYVGCGVTKCTKKRYLLVCNYGIGDILEEWPYRMKQRR
nr:venom allergen (val) protein [Hymenolepis microstoma]